MSPSGLRGISQGAHVLEQHDSYTAATRSVTPATQRPARSHANGSPAIQSPESARNASAPAPSQVVRYPAVKMSPEMGERSLVIWESSATVGDTDGNIIVAIITTQDAEEEPAEACQRPDHGLWSMPCMRSAVHRGRSRRARRAARRGRGGHAQPQRPARDLRQRQDRCCTTVITRSGGPGELGGSRALSCPRTRCQRR